MTAPVTAAGVLPYWKLPAWQPGAPEGGRPVNGRWLGHRATIAVYGRPGALAYPVSFTILMGFALLAADLLHDTVPLALVAGSFVAAVLASNDAGMSLQIRIIDKRAIRPAAQRGGDRSTVKTYSS